MMENRISRYLYNELFNESNEETCTKIGISDISCKTTLNRYYGFTNIIIRKTQATHDIILS